MRAAKIVLPPMDVPGGSRILRGSDDQGGHVALMQGPKSYLRCTHVRCCRSSFTGPRLPALSWSWKGEGRELDVREDDDLPVV